MDTFLEESMKKVQEQNFNRSMYEHNLAATQMNWRPESSDYNKRAKVLSGHKNMLSLLARSR